MTPSDLIYFFYFLSLPYIYIITKIFEIFKVRILRAAPYSISLMAPVPPAASRVFGRSSGGPHMAKVPEKKPIWVWSGETGLGTSASGPAKIRVEVMKPQPICLYANLLQDAIH